MEENYASKERHGCVTAYLIFMIIANAGVALMYLVGDELVEKNSEIPVTPLLRFLLAIIGALNLIFAIMLFKWKRWAFYGFALTSIATLVINLSVGMGIGSSLMGLAGVGILFGVLQIKKDGRSAWDNLY